MRVQTAIVTIGLCLTLLSASAAGNGGERALLAAATTSIEQVAITDGRDSLSLPGAAPAVLLTDRVAFVARTRDGSPSASIAPAAAPVVSDDVSGEPHPLMMLLSVAALIAYVIGRRGMQRRG